MDDYSNKILPQKMIHHNVGTNVNVGIPQLATNEVGLVVNDYRIQEMPFLSSMAEYSNMKCSICKRKFWDNFSLEKHIKSHIENKVYSCNVCLKSYPTISRLQIHERLHNGIKPFLCTFPNCEKRFNERSNLIAHIRIHTGEKPFACNFEGCDKKFKTLGQLSDHIKVHTGEKNFECKICKKAFKRSTTLKCHYRIHSGEKPFKCPQCDKIFSERGNLNLHIKKKHPIQIETNLEAIRNPTKIEEEILIKNIKNVKNSKIILPALITENNLDWLNTFKNDSFQNINETSSSFFPNKEELTKILFGNDFRSFNLNLLKTQKIPNLTLSNSSLWNFDLPLTPSNLLYFQNSFNNNLPITSNVFGANSNLDDFCPNIQ